MTAPIYQPIHSCGAIARTVAVTARVRRTDDLGRVRVETRVVGLTASCEPCGVAESYPIAHGRRVDLVAQECIEALRRNCSPSLDLRDMDMIATWVEVDRG